MELVSMLREHLDFIALSARAFDEGAEGEAKRLAVSIAALVHDTKASHSLLDQLGIKEELRFIDSATPIGSSDSGPDAEGVSTMRIDLMGCGLTIMATGGGEVRWEAPLDAEVEFRKPRPVVFGVWWNAHVMRHPTDLRWRRRDLVLQLRNKQGGAHVDPKLNERYDRLIERDAVARAGIADEGGWLEFSNSPAPAAVRQIAWELERTLLPQLDDLAKPPTTNEPS